MEAGLKGAKEAGYRQTPVKCAQTSHSPESSTHRAQPWAPWVARLCC